MDKRESIPDILKELQTHAEQSGDDALLDLAIAMEAKLGANSQSISVGNISGSTAVAIGNGIHLVVKQSNLPEALLTRLNALVDALAKPDPKKVEPLPNWPRGKSPFPGLRAFSSDDAPIFFGRTAEIKQLLNRLANPDCHFLTVVGASGSGKSSLVKAGLVSGLRNGALPVSENWPIITFTPDAFGKGDPFDVLAWALSQYSLDLDIRTIGTRLRKDRSGLRQVLEEHLAGSAENIRVLLIIDQFEELFSRVTDEDLRSKFQALISEAANSPHILMIITIRDDFFHYCVKSPVLSRLINRNTDSTFTLSTPGALELYEMITGPAHVAGLVYEGDLAHRIFKDTGADPGALALMAYALDQLYKASHNSDQLTIEAYKSFGGVQGAIGARAMETFDNLSTEAQKTLPQVFRELLDVDESGVAIRKRGSLDEVTHDKASNDMVQALVRARLLVASRSANDQALVEVAHEALFHTWPNLKAWINESQDDLILLRQVRTAANWWNKHGRQPAYLWPDERLQSVYAMQQRLGPELNQIEHEFIRSEIDRLLEELDNPSTTHRRRSAIGERLDSLGDPRPGVGLIRDLLPLCADEKAHPTPTTLRIGERRLWGDKTEHKGLPDIVWLYVPGSDGEIRLPDMKMRSHGLFIVNSFYIAKFPITNKQFQSFLDAPDGFKDSRWWVGLPVNTLHKNNPKEPNFKFENHPRENVSWYDAIAFCRWLNARLNWPDIPIELTLLTLRNYTGLRLPTEWEWYWAASGGNLQRQYTWGTKWDRDGVNTSESGLSRTTAVGMFPSGAAECGAMDMLGNVWEWNLNEYETRKLELSSSKSRVLRGGSWALNHELARTQVSYNRDPNPRESDYGFRIVMIPPSL